MAATNIILDLRHFVSWVSLLKITQAFTEMKPLEVLEIMGADAETKEDLFKVLPQSSYELLTAASKSKEGFYQVRIRKLV